MKRRLAFAALVITVVLCAQMQTDYERHHEGCPMVGPSGALECHDRTIDIVPAVVPRLVAANRFTGLNAFERGLLLDTRGPKPQCTDDLRGTMWFIRGANRTKDNLQVCASDGKNLVWASLY